MTWALCFQCGEVKFGAICPCPRCNTASTGDMDLDIAFSDHHMTKESLEGFGKVVAAIHAECDESELCFWAFIRYVSIHHASVLGVDLEPNLAQRCDALLGKIELPMVAVVPSRHDRAAEVDDPEANAS